jgi:hypothetical protein
VLSSYPVAVSVIGTIYKVVCKPTFYESIKGENRREKNLSPLLSKSRATLPGRFCGLPFSGGFKNIILHFNMLIVLKRVGSGSKSESIQRG